MINHKHNAKSRLAKLRTNLRRRLKVIYLEIRDLKPQLQNSYDLNLHSKLASLRVEHKALCAVNITLREILRHANKW